MTRRVPARPGAAPPTAAGARRPRPAAGLAACAAACTVLAGAGAQAATHYVNARFGFSADIPAGLVPGEAPDNGDGMAFRSRDGAVELTVSAIGNASGGTLPAMMADAGAACAAQPPGYAALHADWAVLSCVAADGRILYRKAAVRGQGEGAVFTTLQVRYPVALRTPWDGLAAGAARSLRPAPGFGPAGAAGGSARGRHPGAGGRP